LSQSKSREQTQTQKHQRRDLSIPSTWTTSSPTIKMDATEPQDAASLAFELKALKSRGR